MLRCLALDDEPLALELLEDNISRVPFLQLVAACHDPLEAAALLKENPVDLVFLDIQMPRLTGLQFIQSLPEPPMFILITAYEKYALDGFNLNVVDYLVKPVPFDRFLKACNKAHELHQLRTQSVAEKKEATHFFVNVDYTQLKIVYADIGWIEGLKDYVKIHFNNSAKPVVVRLSMKSLEEQLPSSRFVRIHKSYIVSLAAVTALKKNSLFIGTTEFPIGESYKDAVEQIVHNKD
jgi:DNA-binding LytR/AlgR family response regulator